MDGPGACEVEAEEKLLEDVEPELVVLCGSEFLLYRLLELEEAKAELFRRGKFLARAELLEEVDLLEVLVQVKRYLLRELLSLSLRRNWLVGFLVRGLDQDIAELAVGLEEEVQLVLPVVLLAVLALEQLREESLATLAEERACLARVGKRVQVQHDSDERPKRPVLLVEACQRQLERPVSPDSRSRIDDRQEQVPQRKL